MIVHYIDTIAYVCEGMANDRLKVASLRAHGNNIIRYRKLLGTNLSDLERQFIERRLNEEEMAMERLASTKFSITLASSHSMPEAPLRSGSCFET